MNKKSSHFLIGLFTISGLSLFVLTILFFTNRQNTEFLKIVFSQNVSGLIVGSPVTLNGVNVGEVNKINIDSEDPGKVHVIIKIAPNLPIKEDTKAKLTFVGITGLTGILLQGGTNDAEYLKNVSKEAIPTIYASPSEYKYLIDDVSDILSKLNLILSEENISNFSEILQNSQKISADLEKIDFKNIEKETLALINDFKENNDIIYANLNELILGDAKTISSELLIALERSNQILDKIESDSYSIAPTINEFRSLMVDSKETVNNINAFIEKLDDDPNILIFGDEYPEKKAEDE